MNPIERLTLAFEKFPGIGPRQARRFVQFLLQQSNSYRKTLTDDIHKLAAETRQCAQCYRWFALNKGPSFVAAKDGPLCGICGNKNRDEGVLFVVEKEADLENVERSGFKGLYFVLGGTVPLAEEHPEKFIRAKELLRRIETDASKLKELILGLSATTEGDHTRLILQEKILPISEANGFKISSLGRGLSTGSELEYADPETIAQALGNRH